MRLTGLHINCTAPFRQRHPEAEYHIDDFEVLSTILSALLWRKYNGPIKLYTDSVAYDYYKKFGMLDIWDGGVNTTALDNLPANVDQNVFWASGKLFAIRTEKAPFVMIDTDLLVWKNITKILEDKIIAVLHREGLIDCYPDFPDLMKRADYKPNPSWSWKVFPCNTALAYFTDDAFVKYYTDCAIDFMVDNNEPSDDSVSRMVFAEQRILSMVANEKNVSVFSFLDNPFQEDNTTFTHLWGGKDTARRNRAQNYILCHSLVSKIGSEFPEYKPTAEPLKKLFEKYSE